MAGYVPDFLFHFVSSAFTDKLRPGLQPISGTKPLTLGAALCPPLVYYVALLLLAPPPPPPPAESRAITLLRNALAILAAALFFRLPLSYHVPSSIGLNYQLGLVGIYGGCRVIDTCLLSLYLFNHVPRRVQYHHHVREKTPAENADGFSKRSTDTFEALKHPLAPSPTLKPAQARQSKSTAVSPATQTFESSTRPSIKRGVSQSDMLENMTDESFGELMQRLLVGPEPTPVTETATTEHEWPSGFADRASWALELELSMRGMGFTWTTADVRHTKKTWLPTVANRIYSVVAHVGPILFVCWAIIRHTFVNYLAPDNNAGPVAPGLSPFDERLSLPQQLLLTAALGSFLMAAFSLAHSIGAILFSPLAPSPLAYFPTLYTTRIWDITSVRGFWSYGWHRLFARLFLVWGVWPGEWLERKLLRKTPDQQADVGKVLGGFLSSAFVHSFSVRCVLGGSWKDAQGEAIFFALNGVAVVLEGAVQNYIHDRRSRQDTGAMWYDPWMGRIWWPSVLLFTGRNFARGWTKAGLVREMAFL